MIHAYIDIDAKSMRETNSSSKVVLGGKWEDFKRPQKMSLLGGISIA